MDDSEDIDDPSEVEEEVSNTSDEEESITYSNDNNISESIIKTSNNDENDVDIAMNTKPEKGSLERKRPDHTNEDEINQNRDFSDVMVQQKETLNEVEEGNDEGIYSHINSNFYAEEITSDDEILTFQCPENYDVRNLLNKTIDLSKDTKLKNGVNKYVCHVIENITKKQLSFLAPSKENGAVLLNLPLAGHLVLRQVLKLPKKNGSSLVDDNEGENFQLPVFDSKKRHPLLGIEWKSHLEKVRKQLKRHSKILRKSLKHEKSLERAEKERKHHKKKLKVELALLKKKHIADNDTS